MKLGFKLAYKNLIGAGLRTWLNAIVLAFTFLLIIFYNGVLQGWHHQAKVDTIDWEYGDGQLLNDNYDPFDPFSLKEGNGKLKNTQGLTPILIQQASIYPQGRLFPVFMKGIDVDQTTLALPTNKLKESNVDFPIMIGKHLANSTKLKLGDEVLIRWRDVNGTFDAASATIVHVFKTNVPTVDGGQIWMPIKKMWDITGLQEKATYYVAGDSYKNIEKEGWTFKSQNELLSAIIDIIASKEGSSNILYGLLLIISLLAIFDTQVLSVFRRRKEIGTYIALGMTRWQVVTIFTIEGGMYSLFALVLGAVVGTPLFIYLASTGISFGMADQSVEMGVSMAERIFPVFGIKLIIGTILLIAVSATIVSFLPARKIAKMDPVNALKGKIS